MIYGKLISIYVSNFQSSLTNEHIQKSHTFKHTNKKKQILMNNL